MRRHKLSAEQLRVGEPLPFDAFDARGRLLLGRGQTPLSEAQIQRLIDEGLYTADPAAAAAAKGREARSVTQRIEVVGHLAATMGVLNGVLATPDPATFVARIDALVQQIGAACRLDADAATGQIAIHRDAFYPARHAVNCAIIALRIASRLGVDAPTAHASAAAALTMNLSMLVLQHALQRQSSPLTAQQQVDVQAHVDQSVAELRALGVSDATWLQAVEQHHELLDGSGYPRRLAGDRIGLPARVLALADQYCALLSEREGRDGLNPALVVRKLRAAPPATLDAQACTALVEELGRWPPGSIVKLVNGEIAVVSRRTRKPHAPIVMILVSRMNARLAEPRKRPSGSDALAIVEALPQSTLKPLPPARSIWDEAVEVATAAS